MDAKTQKQMDNLRSMDRPLQNQAYMNILKETEQPVDWAYEVWDSLLEGLHHKDGHVRSISGQVLANLAKSDPENRMKKDFPLLMSVTKDKKFVTARHTLQSIWKVGREPGMQKIVVEALADRFRTCTSEKNWSLIRYDIVQDFRNLYEELGDESIRETALALIETEEDAKYKKKYASLWKSPRPEKLP